jgi:hypothetical protein
MIEAFNKSMAMTVRLLEKFLTSEVENLHLRIDELALIVGKIEARTDAIERQLSLIWLGIEDLRADVRFIKENFATKDDLTKFATKQELTQGIADIKAFIHDSFTAAGLV